MPLYIINAKLHMVHKLFLLILEKALMKVIYIMGQEYLLVAYNYDTIFYFINYFIFFNLFFSKLFPNGKEKSYSINIKEAY